MGSVLYPIPAVRPDGKKQTKPQGRRGVVGDGMAGRFDDVKQGDLSGNLEGVHVPDFGRSGTDRYEEPAAQESERR